MPALYANSVLDAAHAKIATGNALHVCSGTPADRAAVLAASLATVALDAGDFATADGDVDGRKVTVAAQADVDVTATGTPAHYCVVDGSELLARTEVDPASPGLTVGSTTSIPAVDFEIGDPVAGA